jgi:hypothetical protein
MLDEFPARLHGIKVVLLQQFIIFLDKIDGFLEIRVRLPLDHIFPILLQNDRLEFIVLPRENERLLHHLCVLGLSKVEILEMLLEELVLLERFDEMVYLELDAVIFGIFRKNDESGEAEVDLDVEVEDRDVNDEHRRVHEVLLFVALVVGLVHHEHLLLLLAVEAREDVHDELQIAHAVPVPVLDAELDHDQPALELAAGKQLHQRLVFLGQLLSLQHPAPLILQFLLLLQLRQNGQPSPKVVLLEVDVGQQASDARTALERHQTAIVTHLVVVLEINVQLVLVLRVEVYHIYKVYYRTVHLLQFLLLEDAQQILD